MREEVSYSDAERLKPVKGWTRVQSKVCDQPGWSCKRLSFSILPWKRNFPWTRDKRLHSAQDPSVRQLVGLLVEWSIPSVCHNILEGREVTLPCSYRIISSPQNHARTISFNYNFNMHNKDCIFIHYVIHLFLTTLKYYYSIINNNKCAFHFCSTSILRIFGCFRDHAEKNFYTVSQVLLLQLSFFYIIKKQSLIQ